jgi:hypothetical protein
MATYYKYAERQADSFVNWAEIGKDITEMLKTETNIREEKKEAIDKASREYGEKLSNAPTGEHGGANRWTLGFASDAQQARLLQDRLLKSGGLSVKDYTVMRQNISDGTARLFNLSKEYQAQYKEKMERANSADPATRSQMLETFFMETAEGFANFSKSKPLINPTDFSISIGIMEPDPENKGVMKLTDNVQTVEYLSGMINTKFNYFDINKSSDEISGGFAKYITADIKADNLNGVITTIEDALARPAAKEILKKKVNAYLQNPYNISSILTNDIGGYTFSFTDKSGGNVIFLEQDPASKSVTPIFTDEQKAVASDFLTGISIQKVAYEEQLKPFSLQQRQVVKAEDPKPSGPPINVQEAYLSRVKEKTGLSEDTFSNKRLETANNMKSILSKIPNGTQLSVELDKDPESGIINLKDGDNVIKSFYVYETNPEIRKGYLNEFTEIISNLAGTDGMIDYLGRTGGMGQSGSGGATGGSSR